MNDKDTRGEASMASAMSKLMPNEIMALGHKRMIDLMNAQKEILDICEEANQRWFSRLKDDADRASDLTNKLTATKSVAEAAQAYGEWLNRRMTLYVEDSQKLMTDGQRLVNATMRAGSNGGSGGGGT
jgi:hypothetical protein